MMTRRKHGGGKDHPKRTHPVVQKPIAHRKARMAERAKKKQSIQALKAELAALDLSHSSHGFRRKVVALLGDIVDYLDMSDIDD